MEYNKGNATSGLLASQGLLTNLNDYVSEYGWDKIITGSLADTGKYDEQGVMGSGDWYGITNYGEDCLLYFNQDMFDKYGIAIPTTFDELESAMAKFKENGITALSVGSAEYPTQHLWWQLVLSKADDKFIKAYEMYDGKVDWNSEPLTYATEKIKEWVDKGYISKDSTNLKAEDAGQNFMTGTNPIFFSGTWWHARFKEEAASLDGANWWQRFRAITLPSIKPEIFVVALTCTIAALKVFAPVYMLTKGGPGTTTIVPSYYSYTQFFQVQQVGYGAAIATALTVVIIIVAIVFTNLQQKVEAEDGE